MADEKFFGDWETYEMENWENFMKALNVGWFMRKAAARATSYLHMSKGDDGTIRMKWKLAVKSGDSKFKWNEEYGEYTPDGRNVMTTMWMEGETLKCIQRGEPADTYIDRTINDEGNIVEVCKAGDVECTRYYKKSDYVL